MCNIRLGQKSDILFKSASIAETYVAEIVCPNYEIADFDKDPIFCYGFEVNTYLEGLEDFIDFIPAWFETKNGETIEFLIDETTALNSIHPVYILCNGTLESPKPNSDATNFSLVEMKSASAVSSYFNITSMQVNHRYDRSRNSEIYVQAVLYTDEGYWRPITHFNDAAPQKIRDVNKRDIGKVLSANRSICVDEAEPFTSNYLYLNIFERDWYSSFKSLGAITINGETAYLGGKRKYSHEWYAFDPATISNHPIDLQSAYDNGYIWISNSKGKFKISKIYK